MRTQTVVTLMLVGAVVTASLALAVDDPIAQRRKLMQDNGRIENKINSLVLGKYFPDKAIDLMQKLQANMTMFVDLFPAGSETGGGTRALPAIWTDRAAFTALAQDFIDKAKAAEAAATQGQDAFGAAWQNVAPLCTSCHTAYRSGPIM